MIANQLKNIFGLRPILGRLRRMPNRLKVLRRVRAAHEDWEKVARSIRSRSTLRALLDAPVLLRDREIDLLAKYAANSDTVVEIGSAYGGSSLLMLVHLQHGARLFSIDPFVVDSMASFNATEEGCRAAVGRALRDLGAPERLEQWALLPTYSYKAIQTWDVPIDAIFIDGDHTYSAVKQDYQEWLPKVRQGGIIMFHDSCREAGATEGAYANGWPGPTQLVTELKRDPRVAFVESAESLSVFKRI